MRFTPVIGYIVISLVYDFPGNH